jgi:hypothetical protein
MYNYKNLDELIKFAVVDGNKEIIDKQTNQVFQATDQPKQTLPDGTEAQEVINPIDNKPVLKKIDENSTEEII